MALNTLAEIQAEVSRLAKAIGAPDGLLPTYGRSEDFARPHIEVDEKGYQYVVVERGEELERITTRDLDELLYRIFEPVTLSLAMDYELRHRVEGQDPRRLAFQHQLDLLSALSPKWKQRCSQEIEYILTQHPFDDTKGNPGTGNPGAVHGTLT